MKRFSPRRSMAVGVILLVGIFFAIYLDTQLQPVSEETSLVDIQNLETLRAQFSRDAGKTRLIILVSPT